MMANAAIRLPVRTSSTSASTNSSTASAKHGGASLGGALGFVPRGALPQGARLAARAEPFICRSGCLNICLAEKPGISAMLMRPTLLRPKALAAGILLLFAFAPFIAEAPAQE